MISTEVLWFLKSLTHLMRKKESNMEAYWKWDCYKSVVFGEKSDFRKHMSKHSIPNSTCSAWQKHSYGHI